MNAARGTLVLVLAGCLAHAAPAGAQRWAADVYAGGTRYDALTSYAAATNVIGNLRYASTRLSAYLSAAAPLDRSAPVWTAIGAAGRPSIELHRGVRLGIDLAGDAYAFRHDAGIDGAGAAVHVLPVLAVPVGRTLVELRGGRHDHAFRSSGADQDRTLYEIAARGSLGSAERYAVVDVRSLHAPGRHFPMARVQLGATVGTARIWTGAGRWFGDDLAGTIWDAGASIDIGRRGELWAGVRRDAADPLYGGVARTAWNVGYSVRFGRAHAATSAPLVRNGALVLRLPLDTGAPPSVAGEFSDWRPLPMRADGDEWVIEIPVRPGVYRFAFVDAAGEWFVPDGYPGRMSDDMGGHIAVVVVP